ncbi:MAG: hypothetical protein A2452_12095 [Candidatus Firestonebacteria bacterium RIFOXYC2_FULL_39_67]|nr:MAG: hypothetical protein A2536_00240 [Candidatus Firestonebacteria bacterium RIFOXYD2_FULL_39_29]OGF55708.1 MAG: hypothetical protein A2452_12095 [Candidatus Firestonebacteria bacterium RIFOXYC2_FULL_39_67]OGF57975.1 MAG: hypothetical protein A2497_02440 [Candidatus Firestonebacteria bacterium RifOxyC12_full_39_7]
MKKVFFLAVFFVCALQMNMFGQTQMGNRNFGLGLEFGDYPGVIAKLWLADNNALSAGIGFGSFTRVHLDYLWHDFNVFKVSEGRLPLYYGFGGIINTYQNANANFGIRGTFGLSYIFKENNFDVFFELSPILRFNPDSGLFLSGSVGVRYFFL